MIKRCNYCGSVNHSENKCLMQLEVLSDSGFFPTISEIDRQQRNNEIEFKAFNSFIRRIKGGR